MQRQSFWNAYLAKFNKGSHHYNGVTALFPDHPPHVIHREFIRTYEDAKTH